MVEHSTADREVHGSTPCAPSKLFFFSIIFVDLVGILEILSILSLFILQKFIILSTILFHKAHLPIRPVFVCFQCFCPKPTWSNQKMFQTKVVTYVLEIKKKPGNIIYEQMQKKSQNISKITQKFHFFRIYV